jgi:hypothetical protein
VIVTPQQIAFAWGIGVGVLLSALLFVVLALQLAHRRDGRPGPRRFW